MTNAPERTQPLILLAEDCEDNRFMYAAILSRRGFQVAEAADGQQAIDQSSSLLPDLVVMDMTLPDMDGAQAIRGIRSDDRMKNVPVIVVSGAVHDGEPLGWDLYLTKPCPPDLLVEQIRKLLKPLPLSAQSSPPV